LPHSRNLFANLVTTVSYVPLYPEFGTGYQGRSGNGPANKFVGGAISPPDSNTRIQVDKVDGQLDEGIRPYRGPEEITQSRFKNNMQIGMNGNRQFKLDLLNE
jgi:hypothetical protein